MMGTCRKRQIICTISLNSEIKSNASIVQYYLRSHLFNPLRMQIDGLVDIFIVGIVSMCHMFLAFLIRGLLGHVQMG